MTKTEYAEYLNSAHWRQFRASVLEADAACGRCELPRWLASVAYDQDLHVHHRHYRSLGREQYEDIEVLCRRCHEVETFGSSALRKVEKVPCSGCGCQTYDRYFRICEFCQILEGYIYPLALRLDHAIPRGITVRERIFEELGFAERWKAKTEARRAEENASIEG